MGPPILFMSIYFIKKTIYFFWGINIIFIFHPQPPLMAFRSLTLRDIYMFCCLSLTLHMSQFKGSIVSRLELKQLFNCFAVQISWCVMQGLVVSSLTRYFLLWESHCLLHNDYTTRVLLCVCFIIVIPNERCNVM